MKLKSKYILILIVIIIVNLINSVNATNKSFDIIFDIYKLNVKTNFINKYENIKINNIAPGIEGSINVKIKNNNEKIKYFLEFYNEKNKPQNLYFFYENQKYNSLQDINKYLIKELEKNKEEIIKIDYKWNYETGLNSNEMQQNDLIDTLDKNKAFKFDVKLKIEELEENIIKNPKTGDNINYIIIIFTISIFGIFLSILLKIKLDRNDILYINKIDGRKYMEEIELNVNGMHCSGCENRIKNSLKTISGIKEVEANHETGIVKITAKKGVSKEEIKQKIENLDFEVVD